MVFVPQNCFLLHPGLSSSKDEPFVVLIFFTNYINFEIYRSVEQ